MKTMRSITLIFFIVILSSTMCPALDEMYIVDLREYPGKILEIKDLPWMRNPVLHPVYIRPSEGIFSMAFHKYSPPIFVDLSHKNLYKTNGLTEKHIFSFKTPIQDLDYDSRGRLFFSAVGGGRSVIYHLNPHNKEYKKFIEFSDRTIAQKTRGYWNGYFAFSPDDKLFLNIDDAQPGGSSLYEYQKGNFIKRFSHKEKIRGFTFGKSKSTIYFANGSNRVYELKQFSRISIKREERDGRMINDVEAVVVPDKGDGAIAGRLRGGREYWSNTEVQALGPNVFWRKMPNSNTRVSRNGSYVLRNLPGGRYRVSTDLPGDTMDGFNPRYRMVNCGKPISGVSFSYSNNR